VVGLGLVLASCGGGTESPTSTGGTTGTQAQAATAQANNSVIRCSVSYDGQIAEMAVLDMAADPVCNTFNQASPKRRQALVLGENRELANVIVMITEGLPSGQTYSVPTEPAVFTQSGCQYDPHVIVVRAGQPVRILNPDGTLHNVHVRPAINTEFNEAMPQFRAEITKTFDKAEPEPFPIQCDVHPWMNAYAAVSDHPYFAVTTTTGAFEIPNLPAGTYTVQVWHERLGKQTASVTVAEGATQEVAFTMTVPS